MKTSKLLVGILTLVCAMLFVSSAFAGDITVDNPSFETLPTGGLPFGCGTGCSFSIAPIPGWTGVGAEFGQFQPGSADGNTTYFDSVPNGITVAYSNGGIISQIVGPTVQNGVTYTLQVDIGARNDLPDDGTADLMLGSTVCAAGGSTPSPGNWSVFTATCTGSSANAGDPITILLNSSGAQGDFDEVVLTDSLHTTAEPSTLILFGSGLLAFAYLLRSKRFAQP